MTLIAAIGSKGGTGKTTTLACFSEQLLKQGVPHTLCDSDPQGSLIQISKLAKGRMPQARAVFPIQFTELAQEEGLVLLDTPSGLREESLTACGVADAVIVPASPSAIDLHALGRTLKQVLRAQQLRDKALQVVIVPVRINRREKSSRDLLKALGRLGMPVASNYLSERSAYRRASGSGGLAGLPASSRRLAVREIEALSEEIFQLLGLMEGALA